MRLPAVREPGWRKAACAAHARPDLWTSHGREEREAARHICATCPILAACGDWAVAAKPLDNSFGIWGGMTGAERFRRRKALLRQAREAAAREREAARLAARRERQNEYNRRSEKLRRTLGRAPTTRDYTTSSKVTSSPAKRPA